MHAAVDRGRGHFEMSNTYTARTPFPVTTTLYDLMSALQNSGGPDNDDLIVSLVESWFLSGHITFPARHLHAPGFLQGDF